MTGPIANPAVTAIVEYHEQKSPGTPIRAVLTQAAALGYRVVPPATGTNARYLRLVFEAGRAGVTLYLDGAKLTSNGKALRAFALTVPGGHETPRDVQYRFDTVDPATVLAAFRDNAVRGGSSARQRRPVQTPPSPPTPVAAWRKPVPSGAAVYSLPPAPQARRAPHRGRRVAGLAGIAALAAIIISAVVGGNAPPRPASQVASAPTSSSAAARAVVVNVPPPTTSAAPVVAAPVLGMTCPAGGSTSSPIFGHQISATGPYTVTIDYGDGDRYTNDAQHLDAIFTHSYKVAGNFTVSAVLTDATGQSADASCAYSWAPPVAAPAVPGSTGGGGTGTTGGSGSGGTYTNSDGNQVPGPVSAPAAPPGATAQCRDGTYSFSQHRSGTCSSHGGVATWINGGPPG